MKSNFFKFIAILVTISIITLLLGIILSLYVDKTLGLVFYIVGGIGLLTFVVLIIIKFIKNK